MLMPALSKAREKARAITCTSNLKQMGISFAMYEDDNKMWTPQIYDGALMWMNKLRDGGYVNFGKGGKQGVFACPTGGVDSRYAADTSSDMANCQTCYGMWRCEGFLAWSLLASPYGMFSSYKVYPSNTEAGGWESKLSSSISAPADLTILMDSVHTTWSQCLNQQYYYVNRYTNIDSGAAEKLSKRHGGRGNLLLGDGHVEMCGTGELYNYGWRSATTSAL